MDLRARVLRNQELSAGGERFDAAGEVDIGADRRVLGPAQGADVADNHSPGVNADAHFEFRSAFLNQLLVDLTHSQLHGKAAGDSLGRVLLTGNGGAEDDE